MTDTTQQKALAVTAVKPLSAQATAMLTTIEGMEIFDDATLAQVAEMRRQIQNAARKVKAEKSKIRQPMAQAVRAVDQLFAPTLTKLSDAEKLAKEKMDQYARAQFIVEQQRKAIEEEEARNLEEKARAEADDIREHGDAETAEIIEKQAAQAVRDAQLPAAIGPVRTENVMISTRKTWRGKIISTRHVCRAIAAGTLPTTLIKAFDQKVIDEIARELEKDCERDGIVFYQEISTSTR